jgi:hypothetical protein
MNNHLHAEIQKQPHMTTVGVTAKARRVVDVLLHRSLQTRKTRVPLASSPRAKHAIDSLSFSSTPFYEITYIF